jgi:hypothetical protein
MSILCLFSFDSHHLFLKKTLKYLFEKISIAKKKKKVRIQDNEFIMNFGDIPDGR